MQKGFYYGDPSFLADFFAPFLTEILVEEHYNNNIVNVFIIRGNISGGDSKYFLAIIFTRWLDFHTTPPETVLKRHVRP